MKWLGATGAVLALSAVGFVSQSSSASGATTITAGPGSRITCTISGTAKLSPGLSNPWLQSDHSGANADPNSNATIKAAMASIADDSTWLANGGANTPVTTSAKVSGSCSGTVKDATNNALTDTVSAAAISALTTSVGDSPASCGGLADPGTNTYTTTIKWTGTTAKITPTVLNSTLAVLADAHGVGFQLTSAPADVQPGSFASAGSHSVSNAYVDGGTIFAIAGGPPTFDAPTPSSVCQPAISAKFTAATVGASDAVAIKLKKPKSLKAVGITTASGDSTPSSLCINSTGTAAC